MGGQCACVIVRYVYGLSVRRVRGDAQAVHMPYAYVRVWSLVSSVCGMFERALGALHSQHNLMICV